MAEPPTPVTVEDTPVKPRNPKKRKRKTTDDGAHTAIPPETLKVLKRVVLSLTKPSYLLGVGSTKPRSEHRARLTKLLQKLVRQQNWVDASGVLSVLLKAGRKDKSPANNRFKYWVLLGMLERLGGKYDGVDWVKDVYKAWLNKNVTTTGQSVESRFAGEMERALFFLKEGNLEEALNQIGSLKQLKELGNNPLVMMIFGLINMQLWYSNLPEEMQWRESDQFATARQHEIVPYSEVEYAVNTHKTGTAFQCGSDTSVMNDKVLSSNADSGFNREISVGLDNIKIEISQQNFGTQNFYVESAENSENDAKNMEYAPIFAALEGLESLLLPIRLPDSTDTTEDFMNICDNYFEEAVMHLRQALHSTPPVLMALHPLIQLLLIGGQVKEVLNELEYCSNYNSLLSNRLRAEILEQFDRYNGALLCTSRQDILKNDPTCCDSLEKLVLLHHNGEYSSEHLLQMIALHLDATYAEDNTWREFALCFLKLSQYEEDRLSGFPGANAGGHSECYSDCFNKTPKMFIEGESGESWRFRCRWWRTRHFSPSMLASEIASGDFQLLTYKAACAAHMYGSEFYYVVDGYACLKKRKERDLLMFLKTHMRDSVGIYSNFEQRTG